MPNGRFAPSPTGPLHLGSLRTALVAWLMARSSGSRFVVRIEDLERIPTSDAIAESQLADLAAIGLDWDGAVVRQSDRLDSYRDALGTLESAGLLYPCYCTRREINEATSAPHGNQTLGVYPGTCRHLTAAQCRAHEDAGRRPAMRLTVDGRVVSAMDRWRGAVTMVVDDFVVCRNDGMPAYNLAVVLDDAAQGVDEVVRGADLIDTTPRQVLLAQLLGLAPVAYAHVGMAVGADGVRLAKRHGSVTLADLSATQRLSPAEVCGLLARSLALPIAGPCTAAELIAVFDPERVPLNEWIAR